MTKLALIGDEVLAPGTLSLAELAQRANSEHALVQQAGEAMLSHAIAAGEALLAARKQIPRGRYLQWLNENFDAHRATADIYQRVARHQQYLVENDIKSVSAAKALLHQSNRPSRNDQVAEAHAMRSAGKGYKEIARVLGISQATAFNWCNPRAVARRNEARRVRERTAKAALERQQRDAAVRKKGGTLAEAYSLLRKAAQELEKAEREEQDKEARQAIATAIGCLYTAEDELVRANGVSKPKERAA